LAHLAVVSSFVSALDTGETRAQAFAHFAAQGALKGLSSVVLIAQFAFSIRFLEYIGSSERDNLNPIFRGSEYALFYSRILLILLIVLFLAIMSCCKPVDQDEQVLSFVTGQISLTPPYQAAL